MARSGTDALFPPSPHLRRCSTAAKEDDGGVLSLLDDIPYDIFPREKATRMRRRIPPRRPPEYDEEDDETEVEEEKKEEPMTLSFTDPPDHDNEETEWELINFNTAEMERKMEEEMMEENEKATK